MTEPGVGESVEMQGSGSKPYIIKNHGPGGWSCSCPAWRNQSMDPALRTCKHIRKLRGEDAEAARLASVGPLPSRKPDDESLARGPGVLLAESWDTVQNLAGWWMSEKLDGVRAYWDGKQFISRAGNVFFAPDWFLLGLPATPLDGELWLARKAFNEASGIAQSIDKGERWRKMRYVVFDAPAHGGPFEARMRYLADLIGGRGLEFASLLEQQACRSIDHLHVELARVEALGGEGLMMRQPGSLYVAGRSSTLLKVKRFHDAEAKVVGHLPGEGKHAGRVGALRVELPNGVQFSVGTGLKDAERVNPPPLGTIITFRYQELFEGGVPRFPSYVGVRKDGGSAALPATPALGGRSSKSVKTGSVTAEVTPETRKAWEGMVSELLGEPETVTLAFGRTQWEATRTGATITLKFGSDAVKTKTETFASVEEAKAALAEMVAEKRDDGFTEPAAAVVEEANPAPPADAGATPKPAPRPGGRRRFEFVEGTSSKFWEVWLEGSELRTCYGRIGSNGVTTVKPFPDVAAAEKARDKLIREKTGKGYVEKG
jgi:DNA ligase-1